MKLYILASVILFGALIAYENRKHQRNGEKQEKSFWERERMANAVRRKPLDNLAYITIPEALLSMPCFALLPQAMEKVEILQTLSTQKIVNFTGISNTDLKLQYGAPNINLLTEYDQNYTLLVRTLQQLASILYENSYVSEAKELLEFAVSTKTDVSKTYSLLAQIYWEEGTPEKKQALLDTAMNLNTPLKSSIVRKLQESDLYID